MLNDGKMKRNLLILASLISMVIIALLVQGCSPKQNPVVINEKEKNVQKKAEVIPSGVPILMYHSVANEQGNDAVISPKLFAEHMAYLANNGYNTITLAQLYGYLAEKKGLPPKPVLITFDDGYRDTYEVAWPILRKYGHKSVLFLSVKDVGERLTWAQVREMKSSGMEIASHSYNHERLAEMPANKQLWEIKTAQEILYKEIGVDSRSFCFPYSSYNDETLRILRENNYLIAFSTNPGWAKPSDNLLTLKRVWVGNGVDLVHFAERLSKEDYSIL